MKYRFGLVLVSLFAVGVAWMLLMSGSPPPSVGAGAWQAYQSRYISVDGRVIDTGNQNVSHSEGQGFGMLLAVAARDRKGFDRLWDWTRSHLRVRQDALCAWRWVPGQVGSGVTDTNNATDGDLYIAWALFRAGRLWGGDYQSEALRILDAVKQLLVRHVGAYTVLLPGAYGFSSEEGFTLNLSYWLFPAFSEFAQIDPDPVWEKLRGSGLSLLEQTRFGRWQLPADWIVLTQSGEIRLAKNHPPRFGFDAVRIPLLLKWGQIDKPDLYAPFQAWRDQFRDGARPGWVDLQTDSVADFPASAGADLVLKLSGPVQQTAVTELPASLDYYGASLWLLGQLAATESKR